SLTEPTRELVEDRLSRPVPAAEEQGRVRVDPKGGIGFEGRKIAADPRIGSQLDAEERSRCAQGRDGGRLTGDGGQRVAGPDDAGAVLERRSRNTVVESRQTDATSPCFACGRDRVASQRMQTVAGHLELSR